jgi:integrase/recombinase XerD
MDHSDPREMATKIVRLLKKQNPDYNYLKKCFEHIRDQLGLRGKQAKVKKLPDLLTADELKRFCDAVRAANHQVHTVMIKLLVYTGIRNAELANLAVDDVDVQGQRIRIQHGKGGKDRYVPFPASFRGELAQYVMTKRATRSRYLFESYHQTKFSTRWIRELVHQYAAKAGLEKRIYPHLFRHQLLTHLARKGVLDSKLQLISGHSDRESLAIYQELSLADVELEYQTAMGDYPIL